MITYANVPEYQQSKNSFTDSQLPNDPMDAGIYWQRLFGSVQSEPRLHSFPTRHQWPRSETTIRIPDALFDSVLEFIYKYSIRMDDLVYGIWSIVSIQHMAGNYRATIFTIDGRDHPFSGSNALNLTVNQDFPLILSVPENIDLLSWIWRIAMFRAEASENAHIGYKQIIKTTSANQPQVKITIDSMDDEDDGEETVMSADDDFPLVLNVSISTKMKISMRHNSAVHRMDARVLLDHFAATLQHVIEHHHSTISALEVMSSAERQLLHDYGKAAMKPKSGLIHSLIERQANLMPDANALQFETESPVTYSMLNERANQLARRIKRYNPRYVPVHMRPSIDFIIALLAILKAGAAYAIIDPTAPTARKSFILEDIAADFVLVDEITAGEFPNEKKFSNFMTQSTTNETKDLATDQLATDIAYVIYTSGSTGKPKAVQVEHQAAYNGLLSFPKISGLRQLLFFNPVFSAAQRSIWATLSVGGCLCLASKNNLTVHLTKTINTMDINSIDINPTSASLLSPDAVPSLRRMVLGGEMVNPTVIQTWAHRVELLSSYGLSECTQLNWRYRLQPGISAQVIGQPFDTTKASVLKPGTTELSAFLVPGEICLGGAQLARGYLNNPEETRRRFIRNPFGPGRLYRTGDMAVRHADGSIELIGRIDFQVKINGQKVDPSEPNCIIQAHKDVDNSAVVPAFVNKKDALIAVVVSRTTKDWHSLVEALRSIVARRLPQYMIPGFWVPLPELPRNANGKIDMRQIQTIVQKLHQSGQLLPTGSKHGAESSIFTKDQKLMKNIWSRFLSIPESVIALEDSFIGLGGTSFEAIQVVSELQTEHSLNLRVEDILLGESLLRVADAIRDQRSRKLIEVVALTPFSLLPRMPSLDRFSINLSKVEDAFPVTPFQEAIIANTLMGGTNYISSHFYNIKEYSRDSVKSALQTLMRSETLLRTSYFPEGSTFLQVVWKSADVPWGLSDKDLKQYLQFQHVESMKAGDLWWKAVVLSGDVLVITMNHALFDYWSSEFLSQDLARILSGLNPVQRPSFNRYVAYLQQQDDVTMHGFWKSYLDGAKPVKLDQPTASENIATGKLSTDLKATASKFKVTPSVLLYAVWSIVLSITGSTDDVVMGVTLSGRDAPISGILQMSGATLQVAPLRIKVDQRSSFETHLANVQSSLFDVSRHSQYGLRNILKSSKMPSDIVKTFVNFLFKASPGGGLERLPETTVGALEYIKLEMNNEDLTHLTLASTLDPAYSQAFIDSIADILDTISNIHVDKIGHLELRKPELKLVNDFENDTVDWHTESYANSESDTRLSTSRESSFPSTPSPDNELAHSALQRIAIISPWKTAVQDAAGNLLTYAGLAIKVNQLAGILRAKGMVLEQLVPIMMEKSINTVIAMYGILAAGGAFLPLGPENPWERNRGIIEDSEARLVITDRHCAESLHGLGCEVLVIDELDWNTIPIKKEFIPGLRPSSLAYDVYTSGSTGKPKGTLITHEALTTAVENIIEETDLDNSYRILWALNYTFDGSYFTLFPALATGCTLCVAPQSTIISNLAQLINTMNINQICVTPTMATLFHPDDVPTLKVLATEGEPVTPSMLSVWASRMTVYSAYGPTEATICVTTRLVTSDMNLRNIGHPFKNVTASILDPDTREPIPSGNVGELCLAGPQLARGYFKRPDITSKLFHMQVGERFYKTGDLARWLPNGEIELLGRKDDQIKINGYRIELGEIEGVIMQTNIFSQCVVIAATVLKKKQLIAFCSTSAEDLTGIGNDILLPPGQVPDTDHIKKQLTKLPHYMVPEIWIPVQDFPLMPSGKVDRKRLQAMVEEMADDRLKEYLPKQEEVEITSDTEMVLQSLWSAVFKTPSESIHGNSTFHTLGGDSISALNLVSMIRRHGYEIKVNDILSNPTLRAQAAQMVKKSRGETGVSPTSSQTMNYRPPSIVYERLSRIGIPQSDIEDIYPCSPGQVEFLTQGSKDEQFWQLMAIRELSKDFDFNHWIQLTTKLTQNSQILRALYLYIDDNNPQTAIQVVLKHPALNMAYRSYSTEEEKQRTIESEWEARFDPAKPFVRYTLLVNSQNGTRDLLIKLDHASYDGTLLHIFDDAFMALNKGLPLPKHTPFKDYINHIAAIPKQPQLDYWTGLLKNHHFDFPSSLSNPKLSQVEIAKVDITVGVDSLAAKNGVTAPIVFQTAFSLLLAHLGGSQDVIYDNLITGRNVPLDSPQLIDGNCANFLPFYSHINGNDSFEILLKSTQDAFWSSTENGFVSLGEIYDALGRDRSKSAAKCLFCFQPFEPVTAAEQQDHMRWIVMKMSKNRMYFNYAIQLEVVKAAAKGEYVLRFGYDERVFTKEEVHRALRWYVDCLKGMVQCERVEELNV
jgi:amino acid adenylation domain-containing protein